jgi:NADPH:quinone reductase-like Zn-dependent oxidoreductase
MRAWILPSLDGPAAYRLDDVRDPEPGLAEVRVRLRAAALNHLDLWVSRGLPKPTLPHVAGADGAGVIDAVGEGVDPARVGEEVIIDPSTSCGLCDVCRRGDIVLCKRFAIIGEHRWGTLADAVVIPAINAVTKPPALNWPAAAAFGLVTATALRMLLRARLQAGDTMLVVGVGGGVSSAGLLLGTAFGARVFATSTNLAKRERALELGAANAFDSAAFAQGIRDATDGRGVDVVFENVGAATWEQSVKSLAAGGRLVTCGATAGGVVDINIPYLFFKQLELIGSTMSDHGEFARATALVADGRVPVLVDAVYPFEDLHGALDHLERGGQLGKVVIDHG